MPAHREWTVSVVIPAYNAEAHLRRALESVFVQTLLPLEVIVVNDGSTDRTEEVARSFADRIRYVGQSNAGASIARNRGIELAQGQWIAFLDSDDEWLPHKLDGQAAILRTISELRWCACHADRVYLRRSNQSELPAGYRGRLTQRPSVDFFEAALAGLVFQTSGMVIHRSVFDEVGSFDAALRVCQDRDLWWRIAMTEPSIGYDLRIGYRWHMSTPGSLTKQASSRDAELGNICDNVVRARAAALAPVSPFFSYAGRLSADYRIRAAAGQVTLQPQSAARSLQLLPASTRERVLAGVLRRLPARIARRLVRLWAL